MTTVRNLIGSRRLRTISSPLRRALSTAEILVRELTGVESTVEVAPGLSEAPFHIASHDGTRHNNVSAMYRDYYNGVVACWTALVADFVGSDDEVLLLSTHNGYIKCVLRHELADRQFTVKHANCGYTVVSADQIGTTVGPIAAVPNSMDHDLVTR